jgi:hypothetical protein
VSAELLRRAAKVLREHAEAATPGPWVHVDYHGYNGEVGDGSTFMGCGNVITWGEGVEGGDIAAPSGDCYPRGGYSPREDMAYVALMSPPVALALAASLESWADIVDGVDKMLGHIPDDAYPDEFALARAILREEPS